MDDLLDTAIFPLAFFVKIAPVGRATLENWMRSRVLVPAQEGESKEGPLGVFGGKKFSLRNLFKVELMFRFGAVGISPAFASKFAERAINDFAPHADRELRRFTEEGVEGSLLDKEYFLGPENAEKECEMGRIRLVVPISVVASICFLKLYQFLNWTEVEIPKIREQLLAHIAKAQDGDAK